MLIASFAVLRFFDCETASTARAGLLFAESLDVTDENHLFWADFLAVLTLPDGVALTLLPDL